MSANLIKLRLLTKGMFRNEEWITRDLIPVLSRFSYILSSFAGSHILLITSRKEVGNYLGFPVFRVMSMKFLSCNEASTRLTSEEVWFS